ncbi:MAG: GntR family transcriptional regulator [Lachnospiraceae bacterium]|jgi:GntR family transcriptional regulator|nr:GntR family transcriptional regulator [Lachnospiraceae bacterium]MBQ1609055.1 GntR family transcriptional regulator [Lachnospiraceae bacterium]MBQ1640294.1 GntR family transcriptional regulator [Lachnospiraceae bacterium]MBQ2317180.1 GntR family transcriptional regulator [Lachnospiraceae bacterium]MBQ2467657.1 GntR family transcriptional regulator [Lachnospiraceae bacterium]
MKIIINTSSMVPIYEQIVEVIKREIASGGLEADAALPSVRTLSKELKISALTVKKAYDQLESDGLVTTVHGKGTFVKGLNPGLIREEQLKELEGDMARMVDKANRYGISTEELLEIFQMVTED